MKVDHLGAIRAAQALIRAYGIEKPSEIDIEALALDRKVYVNDLSIQGAVARLQVKGSFGIVGVDSSIKEPGKRRFAIAHELGHFELHRARFQAGVCTEKDFLDWYKKAVDETEANVFAAELLMPTSIFRALCPRDVPSFDIIGALAAQFDTSLTATAFRYVEKGYFPCALIASIDGKIRWFVKSKDFNLRIRSIESPLDRFSCAGASLGGESLPGLPEQVNFDCWIDEPVDDKSLRLFENSICMSSYDTILSLIFVD